MNMNILKKLKDGGKDSTVDAYFLCEFKNLFSIALLKFNKGTRENYHSHAFDAYTWFLFGDLEEHRIVNGNVVVKQYQRSVLPKFTSKENLHKVIANKTSWCFTLRGKWIDTWKEYNAIDNKTIFMTHGRKIIKVKEGLL